MKPKSTLVTAALLLFWSATQLSAQQAPPPPPPPPPAFHPACTPPTHGFLGIIMHQEREVININGQETITNKDKSNGKGVYVTDVAPESAALNAGIKAGDIITAINGKATPTAEALSEIISQTKPNDKVKIAYLRNNVANETEATLKGRAPMPPMPPTFEHRGKCGTHDMERIEKKSGNCSAAKSNCCDKPNQARLGVMLETLDATFAAKTNIKTLGGAYITDIVPNSAAAEAGLKIGDVIKKINDTDIYSDRDVINAISSFKADDKIKVSYERNGKKQTANATLKANKAATCSPHKNDEQGEPKQLIEKKIIIMDDNDGSRKEMIERAYQNKQVFSLKGNDQYELFFKIIVRDLEDSDRNTVKNVFQPQNDKTLAENSLHIDLKQYPNPTQGKFIISFDAPEKGKLDVRIADATGKLVFDETIDNFEGQYQKELDLSNNTKGIYFLQIAQNGKFLSKKIILE